MKRRVRTKKERQTALVQARRIAYKQSWQAFEHYKKAIASGDEWKRERYRDLWVKRVLVLRKIERVGGWRDG